MTVRIFVAAAACATACTAHATIMTGHFTDQYIVFLDSAYEIPELGISVTASGFSHSDTDWFNLGSVGFEYVLRSTDLLAFGYGEGDDVSAHAATQSELFFGSSFWDDDEDMFVFQTPGEIGGMLYIGFRIGTYLADEDRTAYNYGFFQFEKEGGIDYRMVGWAYETTLDSGLMVFNIPAPSAVAFFGLAGITTMRRRR